MVRLCVSPRRGGGAVAIAASLVVGVGVFFVLVAPPLARGERVEDDAVAVDARDLGGADASGASVLVELATNLEMAWIEEGLRTLGRDPQAQGGEVGPGFTSLESPCASEATHPCVDGWRPPAKCHIPWSDDAGTHVGCSSNSTRPWCSHNGQTGWLSALQWSYCDACYEQVSSPSPEGLWEPVAKKLRCVKVAVAAGNAKQRLFTFENMGQTMSEVKPVASAGKFASVVGIFGVVAEGLLDLDTLCSDVFDWWTKDQSDTRSRVTLRHLLTFTSGFIVKFPLTSVTHFFLIQRCLTPQFASHYTSEECARQIYDTATHREPMTVWDYNSFHLAIALAMASKRTGLAGDAVMRRYLLEKVPLTQSYFLGGQNPIIAAGMMSNGDDFDVFQRKYLAYEILPKSVTDILETEFTRGGDLINGTKAKESGGAFPRFDSFAMGIANISGCLGMSGVIKTCVNREVGNYYVIVPQLHEYVTQGVPGMSTVHQKADRWVRSDIEEDVAAINKL